MKKSRRGVLAKGRGGSRPAQVRGLYSFGAAASTTIRWRPVERGSHSLDLASLASNAVPLTSLGRCNIRLGVFARGIL
jgi:hypothetical protein